LKIVSEISKDKEKENLNDKDLLLTAYVLSPHSERLSCNPSQCIEKNYNNKNDNKQIDQKKNDKHDMLVVDFKLEPKEKENNNSTKTNTLRSKDIDSVGEEEISSKSGNNDNNENNNNNDKR